MGLPKTKEEMTVQWFNKILEPKSIIVTELTWLGAANNGLGALSSLERVKLTLHDQPELSVIIKSLPTDPNVRAYVSKSGFASREVNMYTRVFSDMEDFLKTRNVPSEYFFRHPICYYGAEETIGDEYNMILILEDLTASNFDLWLAGPDKVLDWDHKNAALREIALLHAVTFAYRTVNGIEDYLNVYPFLIDMKAADPALNNYLDGGLKVVYKMFEDMEAEGQTVPLGLRETLESQKGIVKSVIAQDLVPKHGHISVIFHNDLHNHNVAFGSENGVIRAAWFDFQACTDGPPMKDVTYFLLNCCDFSMASTKKEQTLELYHDVFNDALVKMGVNATYPLEKLKTDFECNLFPSVWHIIAGAQFWAEHAGFLNSFKTLLFGVYEMGLLRYPYVALAPDR